MEGGGGGEGLAKVGHHNDSDNKIMIIWIMISIRLSNGNFLNNENNKTTDNIGSGTKWLSSVSKSFKKIM